MQAGGQEFESLILHASKIKGRLAQSGKSSTLIRCWPLVQIQQRPQQEKEKGMKINVLDKGYVRLVDSMGSDLSIVNAARVSYDKEVEEISDRDSKLISFLIREKHTSPHSSSTAKTKSTEVSDSC